MFANPTRRPAKPPVSPVPPTAHEGSRTVPVHERRADHGSDLVSRPHDPAERTAERAAAVVARGGSVAGWSLSSVPTYGTRPALAGADQVITGPGRPLDPQVRRTFEPRFGHDFSGVRVRDDARAAATAASVDAAAFTIGKSLAFAQGAYRPDTPGGRHLLAHELAHVVQQPRTGAGGAPVLHRRGVFESIGIFLGVSEGTFSTEELLTYLRAVTRAGHIEDSYDSDNKARAVVRRYQTGEPAFELNAFQKVLMIQEMLSGPTLAEDEEEIVALLEVSDDEDLRGIFAPGRIRVEHLEGDIGGVSRQRLDLFLASRFQGGRNALRAGRVEPRGYPRRAFDPAALTALVDGGGTADQIVSMILDLPPVVRERATRALAGHRAELEQRATDLGRQIADETDAAARAGLQETHRLTRVLRHTVDVALQRLYRDVVGGQTAHTLRERTVAPAPTPQQRERIRQAEVPPVRIDPGTGQPAPFIRQLPGEPDDYETKLRKALPGIINGYWQTTAQNRGEAEHADPKKTHQLTEMERIANRAKLETDRVFGHLATRPPLRADQPGRRGNIHDLFADYNARLRELGPEERRRQARQQMFYFFASNSQIRAMNDRHNASPDFDRLNEVARILTRLADEFTDTDAEVTKLHEIRRGWPATANSAEGEINIQLFRHPDEQQDRLFLWDMFQTLIHEYMHTLAHSDYRRHAASTGYDSSRYNTLIEGVDTLLSETVWSNVAPRVTDPALRRDVEGPEYAQLEPIQVPHPEYVRRYGSYAEAVRLTQVVGITNVYAAYFLGDVDKIRA